MRYPLRLHRVLAQNGQGHMAGMHPIAQVAKATFTPVEDAKRNQR
jgi:hypothetical protein